MLFAHPAVLSAVRGRLSPGIGCIFTTVVFDALAGLGHSALGVVIGLAALYVGYKYVQRRRLLSELRMARITVDELLQTQEAGENPVILDLRSQLDVKQNPLRIRGALHMTMEEVQLREQEIPRDRDVILYCSCPNEETSARVALSLHRKGILRVRPLLGGLDGWQERIYPTELHTVGRATARFVHRTTASKSASKRLNRQASIVRVVVWGKLQPEQTIFQP